MANFIFLTACIFGIYALENMSTADLENGQCFPDCSECSDNCDYRNVTFCCDSQPLNCWENITVCNAKCNGSECSYSVYVKHCCEPFTKAQKINEIAAYTLAAFAELIFVGALFCIIIACCMRLPWKSCCKKCKCCKVKPGLLKAIFRKKTKDNKIIKITNSPNRRANQSESTSAASAKRTPNHFSPGSWGNDSVSTVSEDYALGTPAGGSPPPSYKSRTFSCSSSTRL